MVSFFLMDLNLDLISFESLCLLFFWKQHAYQNNQNFEIFFLNFAKVMGCIIVVTSSSSSSFYGGRGGCVSKLHWVYMEPYIIYNTTQILKILILNLQNSIGNHTIELLRHIL